MENASAPRPRAALPARLCTLLAVLITVSASAVDLSTQKLFGKWSLTPTSYALGADLNTAALSPKWVVVGDAAARDRGGVALEGGVQVFSATTGAWVRKILPPASAATDQRFGAAVAISGDLAVVGAYSTNANRGIAYIYNLATGALLRTLIASDGVAGDFFGFNVATNGTVAVVSAPYDDTNRGSIYLFNVATGLQIAKIQASDGAANHYFGWGLAMEGNIIAVGASGANANKGAVYFYDASTQTLIKKYQPGAWAVGDAYGDALSMHEGRVVIGNYTGFTTGKAWLHDLATGAEGPLTVGGSGSSFGTTVAIQGPIVAVSERGDGQGRVHLFRASDRAFLQTLLPPNGDTSAQRFGLAIALDGTTLLATAPDDSVQAFAAGAAHLIKPLTQAMPYTKVVAKGDFAPGAADISYGTIGDAFINATQAVTFTSTLTGSNSNAGKDYGVFSDIKTGNNQELLFKSRQLFSGTAVFGTPSAVSSNDYELAIGLSTLTGAGVSSLNNQLLWAKTDTAQLTLIRTGTAFGVGSPAVLLGTTPQSIIAPVTAQEWLQKGMGAICTLRVGLAAVAATDDTALYLNKVGTSIEALRETADAPLSMPGVKIGQFAPRLAVHFSRYVYSTALTGTGITTVNNAAIFNKEHGVAATLVAQKNDQAVNEGGALLDSGNARYSAFLAESCPADGGEVYRATLTGTGVTTASNEGVWVLNSTGARKLALRKGQSLAALPGLKIARIVQFQAIGVDSSTFQCLAIVQLSGTGITAANDQALLLWQTDGSILVLMREGDPASGCPGAKIGVISRVESHAYSMGYAVLTTLTGATTTSDQALFTGNVNRGNTTTQAALRRPFLRLRKGQLFDNQPGKVKSISLPTGNITTGGAGSTGRGHAISPVQGFVFVAEFDNGVRQIMKGSAN
jgi:hypothetical protein